MEERYLQKTSDQRMEKTELMRQLEEERKKLNELIRLGPGSEGCLAASRRVDRILERLIDQ